MMELFVELRPSFSILNRVLFSFADRERIRTSILTKTKKDTEVTIGVYLKGNNEQNFQEDTARELKQRISKHQEKLRQNLQTHRDEKQQRINTPTI